MKANLTKRPFAELRTKQETLAAPMSWLLRHLQIQGDAHSIHQHLPLNEFRQLRAVVPIDFRVVCAERFIRFHQRRCFPAAHKGQRAKHTNLSTGTHFSD